MHSHFSRESIDYSVGADVVAVGPQTNVDSLQRSFHKLIGAKPPSETEFDQQIENDFYPTVIVEVARRFQIGRSMSLRPFTEARVGDENLVRVGVDLTIARIGHGGILIRDKEIGQRCRINEDGPFGANFILGADLAYVEDTAYIPLDLGLSFEDTRARLRIGVHWQGKKFSAFYGAVYLSEEFETQSAAQAVGSLNFKIYL